WKKFRLHRGKIVEDGKEEDFMTSDEADAIFSPIEEKYDQLLTRKLELTLEAGIIERKLNELNEIIARIGVVREVWSEVEGIIQDRESQEAKGKEDLKPSQEGEKVEPLKAETQKPAPSQTPPWEPQTQDLGKKTTPLKSTPTENELPKPQPESKVGKSPLSQKVEAKKDSTPESKPLPKQSLNGNSPREKNSDTKGEDYSGLSLEDAIVEWAKKRGRKVNVDNAVRWMIKSKLMPHGLANGRIRMRAVLDKHPNFRMSGMGSYSYQGS
ncbi:MAG: hypothetical protein OXF23_03145, partial [Candidatus Dadabacteria bacterium]|nr:hypothetical protein [Candidatus Dadabacteria bacterium]